MSQRCYKLITYLYFCVVGALLRPKFKNQHDQTIMVRHQHIADNLFLYIGPNVDMIPEKRLGLCHL